MANELKKYILSLIGFMVDAHYVEGPIPKIRLCAKEQTDDPRYAKTGHYCSDTNEIVLYTYNRHPKDILRTLAHELIHVHQDHEGRLDGFDAGKALKDDEVLMKLEAEAFLKGNLALRNWTELYTKGRN